MKTRTQQIEELQKEWTQPRWEGITRPYSAEEVAFRDRIDVLHQYGSLIGTAVSAFFLLAMALLNLFILFNVWR
ncbi:hypothetical protein MJI69_31465, partial [Salmonella enterica subsp. enterica serovar Anatum]|nr:hypothetical protein [Salmonella enterica subsp. enterica serovar Anatum]